MKKSKAIQLLIVSGLMAGCSDSDYKYVDHSYKSRLHLRADTTTEYTSVYTSDYNDYDGTNSGYHEGAHYGYYHFMPFMFMRGNRVVSGYDSYSINNNAYTKTNTPRRSGFGNTAHSYSSSYSSGHSSYSSSSHSSGS